MTKREHVAVQAAGSMFALGVALSTIWTWPVGYNVLVSFILGWTWGRVSYTLQLARRQTILDEIEQREDDR